MCRQSMSQMSRFSLKTADLEPSDEVAGSVRGRKSPGDGTGRGGRPAETQTTALGQEASNQWPTLLLPSWT